MNEILLLQRKYTDNLGDVAIGKAMCSLIERNGGRVFHHEFCSLSKTNTINRDTVIDKEKSNVTRFLSSDRLPFCLKKYYWLYRHRALFREVLFRHFDRIVIGGGELLQRGDFCFALYWWITLFKLLHRKTNIFLYSVGVFDRWTRGEVRMLSRVLKKINHVYVRDEKSSENLLSVFKLKSSVIPDSVFANPIEDGTLTNNVLYGITPFGRFKWHSKIALFTDENVYYQECYDDIKKYLESGKKVSLFYTTTDDLKSCVAFNQYCIDNYNVSYPIAPISSLSDLIAAIKESGIVVSARMHACILAKIYSKTVCPIVLSEKMRSFSSRYMDLKRIDYIRLSNILDTTICEVLKS